MNVKARFPLMRQQTNENRISQFDLCCSTIYKQVPEQYVQQYDKR